MEKKTSVGAIADLPKRGHQVRIAYLIVISARSAGTVGQMFRLEKNEMILGRLNVQLQTDDAGVHPGHVRLIKTSTGGYQLFDLGSIDGTYLNGLRIDTAILHDGDKIQIGTDAVLKFSLLDRLEEEYHASIYESATRDSLTGLFNRRYFLEALDREFAHCQRHRVPLSLVMFDVDHFKKINDIYGHQHGDSVLLQITRRVRSAVRTEDILARYGGDEFALLLRESVEDSASCAERCRRAMTLADFMVGDTPIRITISLGLATLTDSNFSRPDELISSADECLYRAKRAGRNSVDSNTVSGR